MTMRIGILTDVYRRGFSGVANHVLLLKEALKQRGQDVTVFAFEKKGFVTHPDPDVIYSPGVTVTADYPFGMRLSRPAAERLRQMDILHIHQPYASGTAALLARGKRDIPMVFTFHTRYDLYTRAYLPFLPRPIAEFATRSYMRAFSKRLKLIITPSTQVESLLRDWQVTTPVEVIPNGIQLDHFYPTGVNRAVLRQQLCLPVDTFLYVFVGRIASEKNIPFLLSSFQIVHQQRPDTALLLIGGGPKLEEIRASIAAAGLSDSVMMTGRVDYSDIPRYLHAADAFVTASKTEVHPLTAIEAAAAGLPAVGLHAPGVAEIIVDQQTGFISDEDPTAFAKNMLILAENPALCKSMAEKALQAAKCYSAEFTAERVLEQYQRVLGNAD